MTRQNVQTEAENTKATFSFLKLICHVLSHHQEELVVIATIMSGPCIGRWRKLSLNNTVVKNEILLGDTAKSLFMPRPRTQDSTETKNSTLYWEIVVKYKIIHEIYSKRTWDITVRYQINSKKQEHKIVLRDDVNSPYTKALNTRYY